MFGEFSGKGAVCLAFLAPASHAPLAQRDAPTLAGRVVDATGATIANASIPARKTSEFRAGFNWIKTSRYQANSNVDVSGQVGFPGAPYVAAPQPCHAL